MMKMMRCAVLYEINQPLVIEELIPKLKFGQVLVNIEVIQSLYKGYV